MEKFIKLRFDVRCDLQGFPPEYRIYVNNELFTERTFNYSAGTYLKEMLQINAAPGVYEFRLERLEPSIGEFTVSNPCIELGDAVIIDENKFEILK